MSDLSLRVAIKPYVICFHLTLKDVLWLRNGTQEEKNAGNAVTDDDKTMRRVNRLFDSD